MLQVIENKMVMEQQPIAVAVDQSAFMIYALGDRITIIDAGSDDILKELDLLCLFLILWGHGLIGLIHQF